MRGVKYTNCVTPKCNSNNLRMKKGNALMETAMTAIEMTGYINEHQQLELDGVIPVTGPRRVRVIVLYSLEDIWDETAWLQAASRNSAFEFLNDPAEDIYTLTDGVPFTKISSGSPETITDSILADQARLSF